MKIKTKDFNNVINEKTKTQSVVCTIPVQNKVNSG